MKKLETIDDTTLAHVTGGAGFMDMLQPLMGMIGPMLSGGGGKGGGGLMSMLGGLGGKKDDKDASASA
jgi:hypothetical protein